MEGEEKKYNKHQNDLANWIENRPTTATTTT
jgi:hypothetical protein